MMAIIVSTADSFLFIPATNLTRDVYQRHINPSADEKKVLLISRGLVLVLGNFCLSTGSQFKKSLNAAFFRIQHLRHLYHAGAAGSIPLEKSQILLELWPPLLPEHP
ncbi:MAG: hypothetical protein CM1200mP10_33070 [Candidatus Neomarinimicrobiota bacterium]|nr:MAG: hypothetical protein CM1200mP10_33070 [Candidatus Neomarinimicrobiota bacterium]